MCTSCESRNHVIVMLDVLIKTVDSLVHSKNQILLHIKYCFRNLDVIWWWNSKAAFFFSNLFHKNQIKY